ncbi:MAG: 23S rRNA (adenine(2503)-C(2))-methyltransferase RlmN, partial [Candidatus Omnitrophica bacterium]|nr:23S rRNA (adenine(2503)-C(2))-methyltransferase RlmN [Candidatus Omnitrophota bacterium]
MTDIPEALRIKLDKRFYIYHLKCADRKRSGDGTEKFLWELEDGLKVESVMIPEGKRRTVCVSTQVGCRYGCPFCVSGTIPFRRNLKCSEMTGQVLYTAEAYGDPVTNVVFMGMGEPLDNVTDLLRAIRILNHEKGLGIGARKITVSTCGIVPGMVELARAGMQLELSVSLHAVTDEKRDELVPANRQYPIREVMGACREYRDRTGRNVTFEYTLLEGVNDSPGEASRLRELAAKVGAKVNLIPCNTRRIRESGAAPGLKADQFAGILRSGGVMATIRRSRGSDIMAACGQLAAGEERRGRQ